MKGEPIYRGRLLKSKLMKFPEGSYFLSNICNHRGEPVIEGKILSFKERGELWKKIKDSGADGRLCSVFENQEDYLTYKIELRKIFEIRMKR